MIWTDGSIELIILTQKYRTESQRVFPHVVWKRNFYVRYVYTSDRQEPPSFTEIDSKRLNFLFLLQGLL